MKPEELTIARAAARFLVAEHFRSRTPIPTELAELVGHNTRAVSAAEVRVLLDRGWIAHPAAGQYVTTEVGRQRICDAINERAKGGR